VVVRYGGDEFVCVMNDILKKDAEAVIIRIADNCRMRQSDDLTVTLSAGIASFPGDGDSYEEVFASADRALYEAKRAGRDQISAAGEKKAEIPIKGFIDRVQEKESVRTVLTADSQRLRAAVISGLVGVGKTRFCREVLTGLKGREVIWTDCIQFDQPLSYYVIRELIRYRLKRYGPELFHGLPDPYLMEISKLLPELILDLKDVGKISEISDRYRLYESIRQVLDTGRREKVIVIDNIQWIDGESLEVLKYVIRALRDSPVTFLFLHRTEEVPAMLEDFLAFVSQDYETRKIPLTPFGAPETKEALRAIVGEGPTAELVEYVLKESGGVPFYIEEIVRVLLERQNLRIEQGQWIFSVPAETVLPGSVTDVVLKKYRSLSREAQQVLDIATILGWFDPVIIQKITTFNEGHIMGLISEINRLGVVKLRDDRYEFSAAVNRNAIYQRYVEGPRGVDLHRQVAQHLERLHLDRKGDFTEDLAYHFYTSHDPVKGAVYCRQAGDRARAAYANRDAIRYYTWAAELIGPEPDRVRDRLELQLKKAEVLTFIGNAREAQDLMESMRNEISKIRDRDLEISVLIRLMNIHLERSQYDKVLEIGQDITNRYEPGIPQRAKICTYLGTANYRMGRYDAALSVIQEALVPCTANGDEVAEAMIRDVLGNVQQSRGDLKKALANFERCLELHRKHNNLDGEARALVNISVGYNLMSQFDLAIQNAKLAVDILQKVGHRTSEVLALNNLGTYYDTICRCGEALAIYERALRIARDIDNKGGIAVLLTNIGLETWRNDEVEKALSILDEALSYALEVKAPRLIYWTYFFRGDIFLTAKQYDKYQAIIDQIIKGAEVSQDMEKNSLFSRGEYFLETNDDQRFNEIIGRLSCMTTSSGFTDAEAFLCFMLGRFALKHGDYDTADKELHKGLELFRQLQDRRSVGQSYYYLSQLEKARGQESASRDYYKRAKQEFTEIDYRLWLNILAKEEAQENMVTDKG
jgi:tetratricopeptide (TPR) repeat protein/Cdc6-like AAA superfamily ATPase